MVIEAVLICESDHSSHCRNDTSSDDSFELRPGHIAQIDFGKGPVVIDHTTGEVQKSWFFVMVLAWSRHMYAELVTDQSIGTWLGCYRRAFELFGGVPAVCMIDNLRAAVTRAGFCYLCVYRSIL